MRKIIMDTVLKPLGQRLGTAAAVALLAAGHQVCEWSSATCGLVTEAGVQMVATWVVAAGLILVDLSWSWLERSKR